MLAILAIETATQLASVALLRGDRMFSRESSGVQTHSQTILPMVQEVLAEADIGLSQCDAIAFGAGPGSFTGVRTACGVAQGLGFGANLPVVPVVTLEAMAEACRELTGSTDIVVMLDAQMSEVYWAQYRYQDGWQAIVEPCLSAPAAVLPQGRVVACGNGLTSYAALFTDRNFARDAHPAIMPHARQVAQLGLTAFIQGRALPARDAQPVYLRNKVAYTTIERAERAARALA